MQLLNPPRVIQGNQSRCWCAALASLMEACGSPCYTLEALIGYVRRKAGSKITVNGDGSLTVTGPDYREWTDVANLFGLSETNYFYPKEAPAYLPRLSVEYIKKNITDSKYTLLIYTEPMWNKSCQVFWHANVVYGVDDLGDLMVMDPAFGTYQTKGIIDSYTYFASPRSPWAPAWRMD